MLNDKHFPHDGLEPSLIGLMLAKHPTLFSEAEIEREFDDRVAVQDALARLHRLGLIHRLHGNAHDVYYWATRAAVAGDDIITGDVLKPSRPSES